MAIKKITFFYDGPNDQEVGWTESFYVDNSTPIGAMTSPARSHRLRCKVHDDWHMIGRLFPGAHAAVDFRAHQPVGCLG